MAVIRQRSGCPSHGSELSGPPPLFKLIVRFPPYAVIRLRILNDSSCPTPAIDRSHPERLRWVEAVEKRICRGRRADLRSQIAAGSAS